MPIYLGNQKIKTLYVGGQKIKEAWTMVGGVLTKVYSAIPPFTPSGMTKNGAWYPGSTYPWVTVPAWTADAGSTVVSDGVTAQGTKSDAVVTSQVTVRNRATGGNECAMRILVGGVVVKTGSVVSMGGSRTVNLSLSTDPMSVSAGQIVTVQIQGQYGFLEVQAGTDTWVRIDRQPLGMTKAGSWVPTASGSWLTVPAWTADPGATVSGDGVHPRDTKANAVVSGQLSFTLSSGAYQVSVRLKVDGVVVKTITDYPLAGYATTNVPIASDPMAVTADQVATIECWFANYANSFPIQSGANTYVRIT
ncbi:hypothetical protein JCM9803A_63570 [Rhodococcus erythropolis]